MAGHGVARTHISETVIERMQSDYAAQIEDCTGECVMVLQGFSDAEPGAAHHTASAALAAVDAQVRASHPTWQHLPVETCQW